MALACACGEEQVATGESKYVHVGASKGAYQQVTELKYVGEGKGDIEKKAQTITKPGVPWVFCIVLVLLLFLPFIFFFPRGSASDVKVVPLPQPKKTVVHIKHHYITRFRDVHVPVPVPGPSHVVYDKVYASHAHYSCLGVEADQGGWSAKHKAWCCWKFSMGCPKQVVKQDKYIHVTKSHSVPVPHYYKVEVPAEAPKPIYVKTPVPTEPLPPKHVMVPVKVPGKAPPPVVHYKYKAVPKPYKVPHVVYDKEEVPVPVTVKKFVKEYVPEKPQIITKTRKVYVPERHYDCEEGFHAWKDLWSAGQRRFCCWKVGRACPETHYRTKTHVKTRVKYVDVPVPSPPKIIVRHHEEHPVLQSFDCTQGFSNWWKGWSQQKKHYCCAHEHRGCPGAAHGHWSLHMTKTVSGGQATGKIYDCDAGFSNWLQGWSDSKKSWCCAKKSRGCVKHHCFTGDISTWGQDKRDWCCSNHQRGCAHTTLSPLGCDAVCVLHGDSSTCKSRMHWVKNHVFGGHENSCNLAYSKVQVDCDVCRACTIQAAGCGILEGATSAAFDCNAALNNFFRAWSPPKKQWCCSNQGRGCEGNSPPSVDPGFGMQWKHVQVHGFWTWTAVHVAGGAVAKPGKPYDCHAGLANWKLGWSGGKKVWCCSNEKMGCPGAAGGMGAGAGGAGGAAASASWTTSWTSHGHPPSAAAHGMMWHWSANHWSQVHMAGHAQYACHAGLSNWQKGWSDAKKTWCCDNKGLGCA